MTSCVYTFLFSDHGCGCGCGFGCFSDFFPWLFCFLAGDLGEKLKEKEGELKKVKDDMAAMKKDLEGQLAAANTSSKSSSEALKVDNTYTV